MDILVIAILELQLLFPVDPVDLQDHIVEMIVVVADTVDVDAMMTEIVEVVVIEDTVDVMIDAVLVQDPHLVNVNIQILVAEAVHLLMEMETADAVLHQSLMMSVNKCLFNL